ncbi:hypothetical protein QBZ16_000480 [Prototheca wickerhamii]|uniref:HORMA domain-containing protein n=1 Tax=Prototheca wickerhamii TaxID=3111 RepID=A0AAD9MP95_PROWI|nr:hypothetical protein QBZ16_000480 [Prototheca wickerhamii]
MSRMRLLRERAFVPRTALTGDPHEGPALRRCLTVWDLGFMGIGSMVGAGIFVVTGVAAANVTGPAVVLSYVIAACAAGLSALNYAELASTMPGAGSAFDLTLVCFGELPAWSVGWGMLLEMVLSCSAVARGLSGYLAALLGLPRASLLPRGLAGLDPDPLAAALLLALSALLAWSVKQGLRLNQLVSAAKMAAIALVLAAGFPHARASNLQPFFPTGPSGVFAGAALVFFSYVGFEMVANAAEEALRPERDLPIAILGSLAATTCLYVAASACIVAMAPRHAIDTSAAFATAFRDVGMAWAARAVAAGAVAGVTTSCLCGLLAGARLVVTLGRAALLPRALAAVHRGRQTPVAATATVGLVSAVLALLLDIGTLAEMVSAGTLYVFLVVCLAVVYRRYKAQGTARPCVSILAVLVGLSIGVGLTFQLGAPLFVTLLLLGLWVAAVGALCVVPHSPPTFSFEKVFHVPGFPVVPALGILARVQCLMKVEASRLAAWVENGIADALEKNYLHKCLFGFAADADAQHLLEQYVFTFSYDPDGCVHMHLTGKDKKFTSRPGKAGVESVKKQCVRLIGVYL